MSRFATAVLLAAVWTAAAPAADDAATIQRMFRAAVAAEQAGEHAKAEALWTAVVVETEKLGGEDARLAEALERLAAFYGGRQRDDEARPLLRRALAIRERVQGKEHHDVAATLVRLALSQMKDETRGDAQISTLLDRAVKIWEQTNDKSDAEVAFALEVKALWCESLSQYSEAETALNRAVKILEEKFGPESLRVAKALDSLGRVHTKHLAYGDSPFGRELIALQPPELGEPFRPPPALPRDATPAALRESLGRQAEAYYRRALAIREKALPPDAPEIAESLAHLGELAMRLGKTAEGAALLKRSVAAQERAHAPADLTRAIALLQLVEAASRRKSPVDKERWLAKLHDTYLHLYGEQSKDVLLVAVWRAELALERGQFDAVAQFLDRALAIESALRGPDDPELNEVRPLVAVRYTDVANDPRGYVRWHRLKMYGRLQDPTRTRDDMLSRIVRMHGQLLQRTNRAVPRPTEDDLAYLRRTGVVPLSSGIDSLMDLFALHDVSREHPLDDAGLARVARLVDLELVSLDGPGVTDAGLVHLGALPYVRCLYLASPAITDAGLIHLGGLKELEELYLGFNRATDAGLKHLAALPRLRELDLASLAVTDAGLRHLGALPTLRKLRLHRTKVTPAAVVGLQRVRPELTIELEDEPGKAGVE